MPAPAPRGACAPKTSSASSHQHVRLLKLNEPRRLGSFTSSAHGVREVSALPIASTSPESAPAATTTATTTRTRFRIASLSGRVTASHTSAATRAAPASARTPRTAPSATRSDRSATSSTSAGRVNAQPATSTAGSAEAASSRAPSMRSRESTSQSATTATPATTPAREIVNRSVSVATYRSSPPAIRTIRRCSRDAPSQSASTSAMFAMSASAFQYSTGERSRATRSPSGSSAGITFEARAAVRTAAVTTDEHRRADARRHPTHRGREHDPEAEKREEDEAPVERVPAPVGRDRPLDRRSDPQAEKRERSRRQRAPTSRSGEPGAHRTRLRRTRRRARPTPSRRPGGSPRHRTRRRQTSPREGRLRRRSRGRAGPCRAPGRTTRTPLPWSSRLPPRPARRPHG